MLSWFCGRKFLARIVVPQTTGKHKGAESEFFQPLIEADSFQRKGVKPDRCSNGTNQNSQGCSNATRPRSMHPKLRGQSHDAHVLRIPVVGNQQILPRLAGILG